MPRWMAIRHEQSYMHKTALRRRQLEHVVVTLSPDMPTVVDDEQHTEDEDSTYVYEGATSPEAYFDDGADQPDDLPGAATADWLEAASAQYLQDGPDIDALSDCSEEQDGPSDSYYPDGSLSFLATVVHANGF